MRLIISFIFLLTYSFSFSQTYTIVGHIVDENKSSLVGANVYIPRLGLGTISDKNGDFKINKIPAGKYKMEISFLGYESFVEIINTSELSQKFKIQLQPNALQTEEVVISSGTYSTQHENAIKIESLDNKKLTNVGNPNIYRAISKVPGVDIISKGEGISTPVIRGLSTSNILVLTDGIRMENYQFSENHPYLIDELGINSIEVVKGPASLLFGSDAIGGVLNFISEKPAYKKNIRFDYSSFYNSNTNGLSNNVGLKGKKDNWFWGIRLGEKSHKDYTDGQKNKIINSRYNSQNIKLSTGINKEIGKFSIFYSYNKMQLGLTVPPAIKSIADDNRNLESWYQDLDNHLIYTKNTFFFNKLRTELNASYQLNHRKLNTVPSSAHFTQVDMSLQTISYEIKNNYKLNSGDIIFALQGKNQSNTNHGAPEIVVADYTHNNIASLLLIQLNLNKQTHLQIGGRYDFVHITIPQLINSDKKIDNSYHNLSYSMGLTYQLNKSLLLRSNFASAFRTPNASELSQDGMHGNRYEKGDPNLKSQKNYEGDLSFHFHNKFLIFDGSAFYNKIDNYIFMSPTKDTLPERLKIYQYKQNNATIYGTEWGLKILFLKHFSIKETYANIVAQQENKAYLPLIPQNKIQSNIQFEKNNTKQFKQIYIGLNHTFAFRQNKIAISENETPEYSIFNINLGVQKEVKSFTVNLNLKINNLFDVAYYDHLSTLKDLGYYNMGRNINLGLRINF